MGASPAASGASCVLGLLAWRRSGVGVGIGEWPGGVHVCVFARSRRSLVYAWTHGCWGLASQPLRHTERRNPVPESSHHHPPVVSINHSPTQSITAPTNQPTKPTHRPTGACARTTTQLINHHPHHQPTDPQEPARERPPGAEPHGVPHHRPPARVPRAPLRGRSARPPIGYLSCMESCAFVGV